MSDVSVIIPRYVCWATKADSGRVPTVLRARTAADAIAQADLLLRGKLWALSSVEPFEEAFHAKLTSTIEPWGRGAA
jgi:hypothetical protein